jgi:hypothetical protein
VRLAGVAGALAMLVPCLAGCGGNDEPQLEPDIRSYLEGNQHRDRVLAVPESVRLGDLPCDKVGPIDLLACELTVRGDRYLVVRTARGTFAVHGEGAVPGG